MKLEQIDTSTTAGKAEVMRLAATGRAVAEASMQSGVLNSFYSKFSATSFPIWDWKNHNYAIIAEPVGPDEVWVVFERGAKVTFMDWARANSHAERYEGTVVRYLRAEE